MADEIDGRELAVMRWLGDRHDASALWNDVVFAFKDDPDLSEHLDALDARGMVDVLDPLGTEKRVVLNDRGMSYLVAHPAAR
jgi:hypothetical protein